MVDHLKWVSICKTSHEEHNKATHKSQGRMAEHVCIYTSNPALSPALFAYFLL